MACAASWFGTLALGRGRRWRLEGPGRCRRSVEGVHQDTLLAAAGGERVVGEPEFLDHPAADLQNRPRLAKGKRIASTTRRRPNPPAPGGNGRRRMNVMVVPGAVGTCGSVTRVQLAPFQFSTSGCWVAAAGKMPVSNWPAAKPSVLDRHETRLHGSRPRRDPISLRSATPCAESARSRRGAFAALAVGGIEATPAYVESGPTTAQAVSRMPARGHTCDGSAPMGSSE